MKIIVNNKSYEIIFQYDKKYESTEDGNPRLVSYGDWASCQIMDGDTRKVLSESKVKRYHKDKSDKVHARWFALQGAVRSLTSNSEERRMIYDAVSQNVRVLIPKRK